MSYPSLQSMRTFDSAGQAVPVMDALALELKLAYSSLVVTIAAVRSLPVKRSARRDRALLLTNLERRREQIEDTLCTRGFMARDMQAPDEGRP